MPILSKRGSVLVAAVTACGAGQALLASPVGSASFTGPPTLNSPTATSTLGGITSMDVTFPETDTPTATATSDGFTISGRFDFLNGAGTSAEVQFTATRPVTITGGFLYTSSSIDGLFGIFSTDEGSISSTSTTAAVTGNLDSFTGTTSLETTDTTPVIVPGTTIAAQNGGMTIPITPSFPTSAVESTAGPNVAGTPIESGNYLLVQTVDMQFSDLLAGETIDIGLPTTSTIDQTPVPEPTSAALIAAGVGILAHSRRQRNQSAR